MFAMGDPRLGEFESGVAAAWSGAAPAVLVGGLGTMLTAILAARRHDCSPRFGDMTLPLTN
jgi:hypothetical protein